MYEAYWKEIGEKCDVSITIPINQSMSYFANSKSFCWFLEPKLEEQIKRVHTIVGNAVVEDRYIIVGTGSSQLILAAMYALSDRLNHPNPIDVVAATPAYSSYSEMVTFLQSGLLKWSGDARRYDKDGPYIEMITSPNNPDGTIREPVVSNHKGKGMTVHDLAYYWPQYTSITSPADQEIMLFTLSKCSGHAGSRIGWALVKDETTAKKMMNFLVLSSIGVSKESQLRAAKVLETINLSCQSDKPFEVENFFEYSYGVLAQRWNSLRDVIAKNKVFSAPKYPIHYCNFFKKFTHPCPAFVWLKCKNGVDCANLLREYKILARSGARFGSEAEYVRASMLGLDEEFDLFLERLSAIDLLDG
ncbi:L-tryptophan--pyruvate aminotransferase 1-like [Andrographis paniculata]|uniref:L-tryptophan--pyruvate aminotransferase 1-like n=1 Tax=Andrographis paniculata TaxID=175694 RepID=UPI0021E86694|nr:L-tryptophan--pyruvate aminotransferase 1-like [Andrographis paniculata]